MALAHLQGFSREEGAWVEVLLKTCGEGLEQWLVTENPSGFEHGGLHRDVASSFQDTFLKVANTGTYFQALIPATADEALDGFAHIRIVLGRHIVWQQQQHIDIRVGKQSLATIATHSHQTSLCWHVCRSP